MEITIIEKVSRFDDFNAWTFEINNDDYWELVRKYCGDGYTTRGTKKEVFTELMED